MVSAGFPIPTCRQMTDSLSPKWMTVFYFLLAVNLNVFYQSQLRPGWLPFKGTPFYSSVACGWWRRNPHTAHIRPPALTLRPMKPTHKIVGALQAPAPPGVFAKFRIMVNSLFSFPMHPPGPCAPPQSPVPAGVRPDIRGLPRPVGRPPSGQLPDCRGCSHLLAPA